MPKLNVKHKNPTQEAWFWHGESLEDAPRWVKFNTYKDAGKLMLWGSSKLIQIDVCSWLLQDFKGGCYAVDQKEFDLNYEIIES